MTEHEKDLIIGRTLRQKQDCYRDLGAAHQKVKAYLVAMDLACQYLGHFQGDRFCAEVTAEKLKEALKTFPTHGDLWEIITMARESEARLGALTQTLRELGISCD